MTMTWGRLILLSKKRPKKSIFIHKGCRQMVIAPVHCGSSNWKCVILAHPVHFFSCKCIVHPRPETVFFNWKLCAQKSECLTRGAGKSCDWGKLIKWSGINHDQPWQLLLLLLQFKKNHNFPRFWNLQTTTSNISLPSQSNWDYMKMHNLVAMYATISWNSNLAKCKT